MKRILILLLAVIFVVGLMFSGISCKEGQTEEMIEEEVEEVEEEAEESAEEAGGTLYYLGMMTNNMWEQMASVSFENFAEEMGYEIRLLDPQNSPDVQVEQMDTAIAQNPEVIFLKSVDITATMIKVEEALAAGIPVILFDGTMEDIEAPLQVDIGLQSMGRQGGEEVVKYLVEKYGEERGKVLQILGDISVPYSPLISEGFHEVLDMYSDIEVIDKDTAGWEITEAADITADQFTVSPDIDAIFMHADSRFPGVISVLEEEGFNPGDIICVGVDGDPIALQYIRDGWLASTVNQPVQNYVYGCFYFLDDIIAGQEIEAGEYDLRGVTAPLTIEDWGPMFRVPGAIVDGSNVDDPSLWGNAEG